MTMAALVLDRSSIMTIHTSPETGRDYADQDEYFTCEVSVQHKVPRKIGPE